MTDPDTTTAPHAHSEGEAPPHTTPDAAPLTLTEGIRTKLGTAPAPLKFAEVKKGLTKAKKQSASDFEVEIRRLLDEEVRDGRAFVYPSGKEGETRYWSRDEKHAIREEALRLAATPAPLADLKKKAGAVAKGADAGFVETVLRDLIAGATLFEHPPKKPNGPQLLGTKEYRHPNDKPAVTEALLAAAEAPLPLKDLVKAVVGTTKADKEFVGSVAAELIGAGQLHEHAPAKGKTPLYGREKQDPLHFLNVDPGKKAFAGLVAAADKVIKAVSGVTIDQILHRLRAALVDRPTPPPAPEPDAVVKPPHPHELTSEKIRKGLKDAYDELCLDVEFQDKVVEIPRLFHEAARVLPGLTVHQFHRELQSLQHDHGVELQAINEVQRAKEPELAIHHGCRLLYFVVWK
ncbi:MAG: hypothetical protein JWO38_2608 [Gemmataceae bacterium]|nr:hypothetical protein [Gemmataceae bacterium]